MIAIVDYGMGNLRSVQKALEFLNVPCKVTGNPDEVRSADRVILPGVGAFGPAMTRLCESGMVGAIRETIDSGKPFFGICLGQQLLFERSFEMGEFDGIGVVPGDVVRFPDDLDVRVPHMGWNQLQFQTDSPLFKGVGDGVQVYFVHSYYGVPCDSGWTAASSTHGIPFAASLWKDNVFSTQFHPEKSGRVGITLLKNFALL